MATGPQTAARGASKREPDSPTRRRPAPRRSAAPGDSRLRRLVAGGTDGNERLTVLTGIVLIVGLAVLGVTILRIHPLLSVHLFLGLMLIGPVALKLGSTGYRFVRYYTSDPAYRAKGPPPAYLRLTAPLVVLTTVVVFASGVVLLLIGPSSRGTLLLVHKVSFFAWLAFTGVHVLGHLPDLGRTLRPGRELRTAVLAQAAGSRAADGGHGALTGVAGPAGSAGRGVALAAALLGGLVLALVLLPQFGPWLHYHRFLFDH